MRFLRADFYASMMSGVSCIVSSLVSSMPGRKDAFGRHDAGRTDKPVQVVFFNQRLEFRPAWVDPCRDKEWNY